MTLATPASDTLHLRGPARPLLGEVRVPGDKSISHRALMLGAIASGTTRITNFLPANDCLATLEAVRALGAEVEYLPAGDLLIHGCGLHGLREPYRPIECGGSGTTMRLLSGLLTGQPFYSVLASNTQLGKRPMDRVAIPLRQMGATILGRENGKFPPLSISGGNLHAITYRPPVASAQVKSAILLAGVFAAGRTVVQEPLPTRDHTERMLQAMGGSVETQDGTVAIEPPSSLAALDIHVPGDISSAAFLLVAASIVPGSRLIVPRVGINPGRTGILDALTRMGTQITLHNKLVEANEPVADIAASHSHLRSITIPPEDVPGIIDELPVLAVAATRAEGVTEVRGASELRVKETDRIATTADELRRMGASIEVLPDGFRIQGPTPLRGAHVSSHGDHRLAMALAVAALVAGGDTVIDGAACTHDSFPGFESSLSALLAQEFPA